MPAVVQALIRLMGALGLDSRGDETGEPWEPRPSGLD